MLFHEHDGGRTDCRRLHVDPSTFLKNMRFPLLFLILRVVKDHTLNDGFGASILRSIGHGYLTVVLELQWRAWGRRRVIEFRERGELEVAMESLGMEEGDCVS